MVEGVVGACGAGGVNVVDEMKIGTKVTCEKHGDGRVITPVGTPPKDHVLVRFIKPVDKYRIYHNLWMKESELKERQ